MCYWLLLQGLLCRECSLRWKLLQKSPTLCSVLILYQASPSPSESLLVVRRTSLSHLLLSCSVAVNSPMLNKLTTWAMCWLRKETWNRMLSSKGPGLFIQLLKPGNCSSGLHQPRSSRLPRSIVPPFMVPISGILGETRPIRCTLPGTPLWSCSGAAQSGPGLTWCSSCSAVVRLLQELIYSADMWNSSIAWGRVHAMRCRCCLEPEVYLWKIWSQAPASHGRMKAALIAGEAAEVPQQNRWRLPYLSRP